MSITPERMQSEAVATQTTGDIHVITHPSSGHQTSFTCDDGGSVHVFDLVTKDKPQSSPLSDGELTTIAISADPPALFVATKEEPGVYEHTLSYPHAKQKLIARSTVEISHITCSKSYVAIASDEPSIRLIHRKDESVTTLDGHSRSTTSVRIDPTEKYVVSCASDFTVKVHSIESRETLLTAHPHYSLSGGEDDIQCLCAFQPHPDKTVVAIPTSQGLIDLYDSSENWTSTSMLKLPESFTTASTFFNHLVFSEKGTYLAASTLDKQLAVFNVHTKQLLRIFHFDAQISSIDIHSTCLVAFTTEGHVSYSFDAIPKESDIPLKPLTPTQSPQVSKYIEDDVSENNDEDEEFQSDMGTIKKSFGFGQPTVADPQPLDPPPVHSNLQALPLLDPFTSGSVVDGPVTLLHWTPEGDIEKITSKTQDTIIKVDFTDKSQRGFKLRDSVGYSMAFLGDEGAIFASPRRPKTSADDDMQEDVDAVDGDVVSSVIHYRPFEAWSATSAWHAVLPAAEDAECVACGEGFAAVATSLDHLRIYTSGGLAYGAVRLSHRVVTLTAKKNHLAVIMQDTTGSIQYLLLQIDITSSPDKVKTISSGQVPMTPPPKDVFSGKKENVESRQDGSRWSRLIWTAFDERQILYAFDSAGVLSALARTQGYTWMPLVSFDATALSEPNGNPPCFPLGITNNTFLHFALDTDHTTPRLRGRHRPVPSAYPLSSAHFLTSASEEDSANVMWMAERVHRSSHDNTREKAEADKQLILMFKQACGEDQTQRAIDLAKCLHLEKSMQIALKVAAHFSLRQLENQLQNLMREKFYAAPVHQTESHAPVMERPVPSPSGTGRRLMRQKPKPVEERAQEAKSEKVASQSEEREEVDKTVAPPNPFMKKQEDKKRGLGKLSQFASPPSKKTRK